MNHDSWAKRNILNMGRHKKKHISAMSLAMTVRVLEFIFHEAPLGVTHHGCPHFFWPPMT